MKTNPEYKVDLNNIRRTTCFSLNDNLEITFFPRKAVVLIVDRDDEEMIFVKPQEIFRLAKRLKNMLELPDEEDEKIYTKIESSSIGDLTGIINASLFHLSQKTKSDEKLQRIINKKLDFKIYKNAKKQEKESSNE